MGALPGGRVERREQCGRGGRRGHGPGPGPGAGVEASGGAEADAKQRGRGGRVGRGGRLEQPDGHGARDGGRRCEQRGELADTRRVRVQLREQSVTGGGRGGRGGGSGRGAGEREHLHVRQRDGLPLVLHRCTAPRANSEQ